MISKRRYYAKETCDFIDPTDRSHPISICAMTPSCNCHDSFKDRNKRYMWRHGTMHWRRSFRKCPPIHVSMCVCVCVCHDSFIHDSFNDQMKKVYVATRNDALASVIEKCPPTRKSDLVFYGQNGY